MGIEKSMMTVDEFIDRFCAVVRERGLRLTNQRIAVVRHFFQQGHHVTVDSLYQLVLKEHPQIGYATVYRTLKLLVECSLAQTHQFDKNRVCFELYEEHEHHDHIICVECSKIIEFEHAEIERLQDQVAEDHGFLLTTHRMELYGICPDCQKKA
ncbi:MAG: transcriptional repressor [Myxococcales bacterium]|nr:transcriptional repressor [Myxococcales bacterium]